jgi:hypothetical protein
MEKERNCIVNFSIFYALSALLFCLTERLICVLRDNCGVLTFASDEAGPAASFTGG